MLPAALSRFVGRDAEVAAVAALLAESRAVTLTGAAGIGKSRLALEVARRIEETARLPATWVELAALVDPGLVPAQVAAAFGLREEDGRSPLAGLIGALRGREALVVLDNCEHVVDAVARLAEQLLGACPGLRMLHTSREPLACPGERVFGVPALALPPDAGPGADESDAVRLFVDRAWSVLPTFALDEHNRGAVAEICRRLDGLPLAIELAAARVRVLSPGQIAARLDDAFRLLAGGGRTALPRHRTMRAAIDWSHALLSDRERLLLRRLAVFAGTFSLEAVEAVCVDEAVPAGEALDLLGALVEKSWVVMEPRAGEARYRLLEVVRQFAADPPADAATDAIRSRHAAFYLAWLESLEPRLVGFGGTVELGAVLDQDNANFRAAADWLGSRPERGDAALRLASALSWHWFAEGRFGELRQRLEAALRQAGPAPTPSRAKALTALGLAAFGQSDRAAIRAPLDEAIAILRGHDLPPALAFALIGRAVSAALDGDLPDALARLEEPLALARAAGLPSLESLALYWRGSIEWWRGDAAAGRAALDEAVAVGRAAGESGAVLYASTRSGILATLQGDLAAADERFAEALTWRHRARNRWGRVELLIGVAGVSIGRGQAGLGARLLGAADAECETMGVPIRADLEAFHRKVTEAALRALGQRAFDAERAWGRGLTVEDALAPATAAIRPPAAVGPGPEPLLRVRALGPLEIFCGGRAVADRAWRAARPRELLLYLLCHPDGATRDQLGLVFWPEASPAQLKNGFHVALHHLRKALERPELIVFERERYRVCWELGVEFDAARFEAGIRVALRDLGAEAVPRLEAALALWRGELLEDQSAGDWHGEHRERLGRLRVSGLLALGERLEASGRHEPAAEAYHQVLRSDPLHEEACRRLMRSYAALGRRGEAIRQYERLAVQLRGDLGAEPEPDTVALFERLRTGDPARAPRAPR